MGTADRGSPSEGKNSTEEPSTDDIRAVLVTPEQREMACHATRVWSLVDCGTVVYSLVEARCVTALL